ncbi:PH domain-containing protein [Allorhizocola rhizosphaerae]|uniref:PH domain-containing protein n=1 Tax=Allorhizocola rhizosphaerae TaxID=1872709 RepID=UPI000E3DBBE2|nr:PH domain-containing protein [Allorhizocola rhizosphaerae]
MIRFRYHAAVAVTALLAVIGSTPFLFEGILALREGRGLPGLLVLVTLVPLVVAIWAWRAGTDANEYGIRVRALVGRRIVPWTEVSALVPDEKGRTRAVLHSGAAVPLTAVKPSDLPRLAQCRAAASPQRS